MNKSSNRSLVVLMKKELLLGYYDSYIKREVLPSTLLTLNNF